MNSKKVKHFSLLIILLILVGSSSGFGVFIFLKGLEYIYTDSHILWSYSLWFFPLVAWGAGWLQDKYFSDSLHIGKNIYAKSSNPNFKYSLYTTLYSWLAHLFSASTGREGAAVQIASGIGLSFKKIFSDRFSDNWNQYHRTILLAAFGAGFSAALNAPLAGVLFAAEVTVIKKLQWRQIPWIAVASITSWLVIRALPLERMLLPTFPSFIYSHSVLLFCVALGITSGVLAGTFSTILIGFKKWNEKVFKNSASMMFTGAVIIVLYSLAIKTDRWSGLGTDTILDFFQIPQEWISLVHKIILTIVALAFGFRGGEFIPLVFIGGLLGNLFASSSFVDSVFTFTNSYFITSVGHNLNQLSESITLGLGAWTSLGFLAVFAGAANLPLTCTVLSIELFGLDIGPWSFLVCYLSYLASGLLLKLVKHLKLINDIKGIYSSQEENI